MIIMRTLLELGVVLLLIYGFIHEKEIIAFEERIRARIAKKIRSILK